ncbi:MAG TPA: MarR family transcriptional regulator [Acidimicrobiales bacterium]|nr:MarR family transcriptional regulator [Acidimicrobiales bacterium]
MSTASQVKRVASRDLGIVDGLVQLSFCVQAIVGGVTSRYDSSISQTRLLGALRGRELTMAQIARLLNLDKSSATGLVDRAASKGYVVRSASRQDGRSVRVSLTAQGRRVTERVAHEVAQQIDAVARGMSSAERRRLSQLASKFVVLDADRRGIDLQAGREATTPGKPGAA